MDLTDKTDVIVPLILGLFVAIVFLQSGLDKLIDWTGNVAWLRSHFAKTKLAGVVSILLGIVAIAELASGILAVFGVYCVFNCGSNVMIKYSLYMSLLTLLMLLFGQRVAKDYEGAKTIVVYFIACLLGLLLV